MILWYRLLHHILLTTLKVEYFWVDRAATGVKIFNHYSNISLQQEILFQRDLYDHCVNYEDIVSCEWTLGLFLNSFHGSLVNRINEKHNNLDKLEQVGIMYLKTLFE